MSIYELQDIVFEVTESEFVHDRKHLVRITEFYREQGYGIALDDLGSGYSSLNLLHDLNPDYIKLDMELVRNIHQSQFKQITMQKIIELAYKLNILTIAEGIETEDELRFMQTLPVNYYQGFYFAKPYPISKISNSKSD